MSSSKCMFKSNRISLAISTQVILLCLLWCSPLRVHAQTYPSELVTAGYRDFSYDGGGVTLEPTESKPESKLWYHDGYWWGVLWDPVITSFRIHRFDANTQDWTNVGPDVDEHHRTGADVLWDGNKLYISSRMKVSASREAILNRYSYDAQLKVFTLDPGFPVNITDGLRTEALTIAKDSEGQMWAVWTDSTKLMINRTVGDDLSWGTPSILPVQGGDLHPEDISAVTAFGGDKIGILWSNEVDRKFYFAVHRDSDDDLQWQPREEALAEAGLAMADAHLNLAVRSEDGTILAAVKTSLTSSISPLIFVLKRNPANGVWSRHVFGEVPDDHTRPMVLHNADTDSVYVFARTTDLEAIVMKSAHIDNLNFPPGYGKLFMQSETDIKVNNPTSTKQSVTSESGMLVLASARDTKYYLHNYQRFDAISPPNPGDGSAVISANFDNDTNDFTYHDDTFRKTKKAKYAAGNRIASGGFSGGALRVTIGGVDDREIKKMSGGWRRTFKLAASVELTLTFRYNLTQTPHYEDDEYSEVLVTVDKTQPGTGGRDYVARITGNGNGGSDETTGWQQFQVDLGTLKSGTHTLTIGGYNNKKTLEDEVTEVLIDDVLVASPFRPNEPPVASNDAATTKQDVPVTIDVLSNDSDPDADPLSIIAVTPANAGNVVNNGFDVSYIPNPGYSGSDNFTYTISDGNGGTASATVSITISFSMTTTIVDADFDTDVDGFTYLDDAFRNTNEPNYAAGNRIASGGVSGGALRVMLGGLDDSDIFGMAGGWHQIFTVLSSTEVSLSFEYRLTQTPNYENDEYSEVLVQVGTNQHGDGGNDYVARITGNGNGGSDETTDWQQFQVDLGILPSGHYPLTIGGYNNKKTLSDESTEILIDNVRIESLSDQSNRAPLAVDDSYQVESGKTLSVDAAGVLSNDSDPDGDPLTALPLSSTSHGEVTLSADGSFSYVPNSGFVGTDTFMYTANDNGGAASNAGMVTIKVNEVGTVGILTFLPTDDAQVKLTNPTQNYGDKTTAKVEADAFSSYLKFALSGMAGFIKSAKLRLFVINGSIDGGAVHSVSNLFRDSGEPWHEGTLTADNAPEISGPPLTSVGLALENTFVELDVTAAVAGDGIYSLGIRPAAPDQMEFTTKEGTNPPELIIEIGNLDNNSPPLASDDLANTYEGNSIEINVTSNDSDPDGALDLTTVTVAVPANNGTTTTDGVTGVVTYVPDPGFNGTDSFVYTVDDNAGATSNPATVTIVVAGSTDPRTLTFQPTDDAQVKLTSPGNNYGTKTSTKVDANEFNTYFKFQVVGLPDIIQRASLRLFVVNGSDHGGTVYSVSNSFLNTATPWDEETLAALNAPEIGGPSLGDLNLVEEGTFVEVDVTPVISTDGFYSFGISKTTPDRAEYSTKEGEHAPALVIEAGGALAKQAPDSTGDTEDRKIETDSELLPDHISLNPNYPNPFNAGTTIEYALPVAAKVELAVYNIRGQQVRQLALGLQQPGRKKLAWDGKDDRGKDISSGVYFLRLNVGNQHFSRKLLLQK